MAVDTALRTGEAEGFHPYEVSVPTDDRRSIATGPFVVENSAPAMRRDAAFRWALASGDVLALALTGLLAIGIDHLRIGAIALIPMLALTAKMMRLYDRDQVLVNKRTLDEAPGLFHLATLVAFVFWLGHQAFTAPPPTPAA